MTACAATGDRISAGWSLSIETGAYDVDLPGGSGSSGPASPYPATEVIPMTSDLGLITDLNVQLDGVFHAYPDDIEILLEKVGGPRVMLMSDACGSYDVNAYGWRWDDEAPALMPDEGSTDVCGTTAHRPTDRNPGDSLPAPAPAAPYQTSLSAFDLVDPRGEWRMWVADDSIGQEGFLTNRFQLELTTRLRASTSWLVHQLTVAEGAAGTLQLVREGATAYAAGTVNVTTAAGTAGAGDFAPMSKTVSFAPGETAKTIEVPVPDDPAAEPSETFTVTLSGPTGDVRVSPPAVVTVTVPANDGTQDDTRSPETTVLKAPKARTTSHRAKVKFAADEAGARYECRLDKRKWKACSSPRRLRNLAAGRHTFKIRAVDLAGNVEDEPAVVRWRVVR